jgi:Protein of unknown function (DUF3363)
LPEQTSCNPNTASRRSNAVVCFAEQAPPHQALGSVPCQRDSRTAFHLLPIHGLSLCPICLYEHNGEVTDAHRFEIMAGMPSMRRRLLNGEIRQPLTTFGLSYKEATGSLKEELKSHLSIDRQSRVMGATWLDQQLIGRSKGLGDLGFGGEVKGALQQRADFLVEHGLAERRGQGVVLARNLLATLRGRELANTAQKIAAETGMEHRPLVDGRRVAGVYRRSVMLASGRYAMLDDGIGFSLVPWKPEIETRLGQTTTAVVRGGGASWSFSRQRGPSID